MNEIHLLYDEKNAKEYLKQKKQEKQELRNKEIELKIQSRCDRIKRSGVNFNKLGWVTKISKLENISHTQVRRFMSLYMPDFYKKCYVRKKPKLL